MLKKGGLTYLFKTFILINLILIFGFHAYPSIHTIIFFNRIYLHNSIFLFKLSFLHYILSTKFCFSFIFFTLFIYVCHQTLHQIDIDSPFSDTIGPQYSAYQGTCCFLHVSFMSSLHSFFFFFLKSYGRKIACLQI
jgi:hypothetical protein